jgi:hypothetical protein
MLVLLLISSLTMLFVLQSPPPLCMYYRWIDTKMPDWAVAEIRKRGQRAWASFHREEQREKAAAEQKAEEERELNEDKAKKKLLFQSWKKEMKKRFFAWRRRNGCARRLVRRRGRERKKGLVRPRQQKMLVMGKENIHAGLSRFVW